MNRLILLGITLRRCLLLTGGATLLTLSSCENQLQEEVFSFVSTDNFYKTAADAQAAVAAIYSAMLGDGYYARGLYDTCILADDHGTIGRNPTFQAVDNWNITSDHPFIYSLWQDIYSTINRANTAIARVPGIPMDETQRKALLAEAYFLRAYNYFNLVRLWGGVPLSTVEINDRTKVNTPKATPAQIYEQIIADLRIAETDLPLKRANNELGRVTRGAAKTLLAEVYLTHENWRAAADKAAEVMASGEYRLLANFPDVFSVSNENNAEIIFSIQYDGINNGNWFAAFGHGGGTDNPNTSSGLQVWSVETKSDIWTLWDTNDPRRSFTVYDKFINKQGREVSIYNTSRPFPCFGKYNAPNEIANNRCPFNPIVHRYADVLLMFAEATSQANNGPTQAAYDAINQVRRRGYRVPLTTASAIDVPAGLSAAQFRQTVLNERQWEFAVENRRLFDLMRTKQFPAAIIRQGKTAIPNATLFPIPKAEIDANTAISDADQNPGF